MYNDEEAARLEETKLVRYEEEAARIEGRAYRVHFAAYGSSSLTKPGPALRQEDWEVPVSEHPFNAFLAPTSRSQILVFNYLEFYKLLSLDPMPQPLTFFYISLQLRLWQGHESRGFHRKSEARQRHKVIQILVEQVHYNKRFKRFKRLSTSLVRFVEQALHQFFQIEVADFVVT